MMRAAPLSKSKFKAPISSDGGCVKRKPAATSTSTRTRTNSIRTKKATNTTGTSLSSSLLGTTTRAATSLTSSRNSRTKEALCQSDSRDFAKALAGGDDDDDDDADDDDKNKFLSKRSMILNQGLKLMKKKSGSGSGGVNGDSVDNDIPQIQSSSIVSLAVTGRKRKAPPSSLLGRSSSNDNCTSGEPPPTSLPTRNEQQITWSTATENQRDELISKLKKNAVYEIFREFGSKRSGGVPVIQVQKEYWRRELVVIDDDNDDNDVSINNNGEQHYQQQEENGDIGITRMSIGEFKVLWKKVKKLLRVDETLITAIDGYKKGGNEVKNNIDNKATNIHDDHRDGNVECSTTTNDVTNDGNVDNENENTS